MNNSTSEFQVNTFTSDNQQFSTVTALADGGFVITWSSVGQDGSSWGIYGQRYDSNGATIGSEFQVNTFTNSNQVYSSVANLADGGFVITWESFFGQDGSGSGIYGQRFDANGTAVGSEFQVNTFTSNSQQHSSVTALADGGYVITWSSFQDGNGNGIYGQRYDSNGTAVGSEFQVNTFTNNIQQVPSVTTLQDGGFVITWESFGQDGSGDGIYGQRYDANGNEVDGEFLINQTTNGDQQNYHFNNETNIDTLADGRLIITWYGNGPTDNVGIVARIIDFNEAPTITSSATVSVSENQTAVIDVQASDDSDSDGNGLTYSFTTNNGGGADNSLFSIDTNGVITFDAAPNFEMPGDSNGDNAYNVQVTVTDAGGLTDTQDITINVTDINEAPTVSNTVTASATEDDAAFSVDLLDGASDPDVGDTLSVANLTAVSGDDSGVTISGNSLDINPNAYNALAVGESEVITYSYDIIDSNGGTVAQTATVTITGKNDNPIATGVGVSASEDDSVFSLNILDGAMDPDASDTLDVDISIISGDDSGITVNGSSLDIDPSAYNALGVNEFENIEFFYTVTDGNGGTDVSSGLITITGENDDPTVSAPITTTVAEDDAPFSVNLLTGASDPDTSDFLDVENLIHVSGDDSGVFIPGNQVLDIDPNAYNALAVGESEVIEYSYDIIDGNGGTVAQTATITITGANDGPVVTDAVTASATEDDAPLTVDLLNGASDPDASDTLSVANLSVTSGNDSGVTVNGNSLDIDPNAYTALAEGDSEVITYIPLLSL